MESRFFIFILGLLAATPGIFFGKRKNRSRLGIILVLAGSALILASIGLFTFFPEFQLPEPTGPHAVGTTFLTLNDLSRPETFSPDPNDRRSLPVQVWYPADTLVGEDRSPYWETAPFFLDHLAEIPTHAYRNVPLSTSDEHFPVLIYSHGYSLGFGAQNTALIEELASHGYVVVSIAHPYEALAASHLGGARVYPSIPRVLGIASELWRNSAYGRPAELMPQGEVEKDPRSVLSGPTPLLDQSLETWIADTSFVIDELEKMNAGVGPTDRFAGRLDLDRLGVLGMSFGGTTAGWACLSDIRIQAGLNLDGSQFSHSYDFPLKQPFMMVYSQATSGMNDYIFEQGENTAYSLTIKGAYHGDFGDYPIMAPLAKRLGILGPIDGARMLKVVNAYGLAFFDRHLRGIESPLLEGPSAAFPEVEFKLCRP